MKKIVTTIVILLLLAGNIYFYLKSKNNKTSPDVNPVKLKNSVSLPSNSNTFKYMVAAFDISAEMTKVENNRAELEAYAVKNNCNQQYAFIIDMRIPSYKKRFFVFDLTKDSILDAGFVAHGTGSETFRGELLFSNIPDSRCTSLGKYKIGASYKGIYGLSYRLQGLDSSNNKALQRAIVLHGNSCVPDNETDEYPICFSYGCPMVSTKYLQKLKGYIAKQGKKPILLSVIY